ncbi:FHIPEP family type III secretion protein [Actinoplanes sp. M2I2]|uniref:FHIPEP family type III secretion protein n=1 Tax=Actinoplanes sp. M2I2 TaxID=1734444 RepID=UPI002020C442|nr:FHIPEP family type III secretion protein [Actinoplanes sp. M2I2]
MTGRTSMWSRVVRAADRLSDSLSKPDDLDTAIAVTMNLAVEPDDPGLTRTGSTVSAVVAANLVALGLPGRPDVTVTADRGSVEPYLLRINGRRVRCTATDLPEPSDTAGYAASVCAAAINRRPSVLLDAAYAGRLATELGGGSLLAEALPEVLDQGVSLADRAAVGEVIEASADASHPAELAEALIARLRSPTVDLRFTRETLRHVTTAQPAQESFSSLRTTFYSDQGVLGPGFQFVVDPAVPDHHFAIRINALTLPSRPLRTDRPLDEVHQELHAVLRQHASRLVSLTGLAEILDPLRWALPDTIRAVEKRYSSRWLAAVTRALVAEGISVRHPATLLDWLLDLDPTPAPTGAVRFSEGPIAAAAVRSPARLPAPRDAVALLRRRWLEERCRMAPHENTLAVHQLPPETWPAEASEELADRIADEVRPAVTLHPHAPLVAPSLSLRSWLLGELRPEFPDLRVLAVQEIPPNLQLVPVGPGTPRTTGPRRVAGVW